MTHNENSATTLAKIKAILLDEDRKVLSQISSQIEALEVEFADDDALRTRIAGIISSVLREAEVADHDGLADAMAPVVVTTIRSEIVNSRDQMVEALYPITGQLVSAYVSNAMRDMMTQINRRLESGLSARRLSLRLKSILVGRPYSELLLTELNAPRVQELYLIRRTSGTLIDRWTAPKPIDGDADAKPTQGAEESKVGKEADKDLVGGLLTAITNFSREAFKDDEGGLQTLVLKDHRIFLRASPAHLVAAKCQGNIPRNVERALDDVFVEILSDHYDALAGGEKTSRADLLAVLPDFAARFEHELAEIDAANDNSGTGLAVGVASALALLIFGWLAWSTIIEWREESVRAQVLAMKEEMPSFRGFPVSVKVDDFGSKIALEGLAPSIEDKNRLLERVRHDRKPGILSDSLVVLPDLETAQKLKLRADDIAARLGSAETALAASAKSAAVDDLAGRLASAETALAASASSAAVEQLSGRLTDAEATLAASARTAAVDQLANDFAALEGRLTALAGETTASDAAIGEKLERLAPLIAELRKFAINQAMLQSAQARTDDSLKELKNIPELVEAVGVLSNDLAATRQKLRDAAERRDLARLVTILETIADRVETLEARPIAPVDASLSNLDGRIKALEVVTPTDPRDEFERFAKTNAVFFLSR